MRKQTNIGILLILTIISGALMNPVKAQLAAGQGKFLGNTHTKGQTPLNFDHYWNQLTPGNAGKWASCEQKRDDFNYWLWMDRAYDHARLTGMVFKEHTLVWGHWSGEPSWMSNVPKDEQMDEVIEWFQALSERYPDLEMIDVVNEPLHAPPSYAEALGGNGGTGWDWVVWCFEKARKYFPNATLILNEYNVLNYTNTCRDYLEIINILKSRNLIDAIGCQGHSLESVSISTIKTNLNLLAETGLDIYVSEYEARGDDATQLALFKEQFPVFWEHPAVKGVTLWGYLEGDMWRSEAYLLASDGVTERPALKWLKDYFNHKDNVPGPYTMTTETTGEGSIKLSPSGGTYSAGTMVSATANPGNGYVFSHWSGDKGGATNPTSIAMTSNRQLTAHFVPEVHITTYTLAVKVVGSGSVSTTGGTYEAGTEVTVTATPDNGAKFIEWTGGATGTSNTITVSMVEDIEITANFTTVDNGDCDINNSTLVSVPFTKEGVGEFCLVTGDDISYVNSWSMEVLEINGVDYANKWSDNLPAKQNGYYFFRYKGNYAWSHFEASVNKSARSVISGVFEAFPNPFAEKTVLYIDKPDVVSGVEIMDQSGRIIEKYEGAEILPQMQIGGELSKGVYYIRIVTDYSIESQIITKE